MTNQEKMNKLQAQQDDFNKKKGKMSKRPKIVLGILIGGTILTTGIAAFTSSSNHQAAYNAYLNDPAAIQFDSLEYEDTFERWNNNDLGNDVNVLLSGGQCYARNHTYVTLADEGTGYIIMSGEQKYVTTSFMSYINVVGNTVYYRDGGTYNICVFNMDDQKSSVIVSGHVGEVFVYNQKIYYINLDDGNKIYSCDLNGGSNTLCVDFPSNSFAVCGDTVITLGNNQTLRTYSMETGSYNILANHIERFFLDKEVYCDSGNTILKFKTDGKDAQEVINSEDELQLVSVENDVVYYLEGKTLKKSTEPDGCIDNGDYLSVSSLIAEEDGTISALGYYFDGNGQVVRSDIRTLAGGTDNGTQQ